MDWKKRIFIASLIIVGIAVLLCYYSSRSSDNMACLFCDIANKQAESKIVYEDENFIGFHDIKPASDIHFLLIPKKHITNTKSLTAADKDMSELKAFIMMNHEI